MDLKAQRTQECLAEMRDHYRNTKVPASVLIVVGRTGAGKSSVLEGLTGLDGYSQPYPSSGHAKAVIEDKAYFVMNTPGFDTENVNTYFEIMRGIESIRHFARITGVLYLTCINQLRFEDFDRKLVRFIYAFSGEDYIPRVTFITTFWTVAGNKQRETFSRQLGLLQREWEQGVHSQHLSLYQHGRECNAHGQGTGLIINWFENRNQIARQVKEMIERLALLVGCVDSEYETADSHLGPEFHYAKQTNMIHERADSLVLG